MNIPCLPPGFGPPKPQEGNMIEDIASYFARMVVTAFFLGGLVISLLLWLIWYLASHLSIAWS